PGKILAAIRHLNSRNFPTYETAMLLTQPCFAGNRFPVLRAYKAGCSGLDGWENYLKACAEDENENLKDVFKIALLAIRAIKKFCEVLSHASKPEKIMSAFYDFLTTDGLWLSCFDNKAIAEFPELDETLRITASAIETISGKVLALSELLPDLGAVQTEELKNDEAFDFLERWCANTNTRAPLQISNAIRVFTGTPPVLSFFPVWIMTGVTQKTWSANVNSSPLLGTAEREKLAAKKAYLPSTVDKAAQHEALFRRLVQSGERVTVISRPELDEEGRPLSESPFFEKFCEEMPWTIEDAENSAEIKIFLGSDGFIFPKIDPSQDIFRKPPVIFKTVNAVGASDIHKLLSCPFLWWQEKQANLYPQNMEIVNQIEWGLMLHKFWERVWRRYRINTKQDFYKLANDEWNRLTSPDYYGVEIEDYKNFSRLIHDFRLKRKLSGIKFRVERLTRLQNDILNRLNDIGYTHEKILLEDEAQLKIHKDGITFLGQCDRIEILRAPDGERVAFIADYKEGSSESSENSMTDIENYSWNVDNREKFFCGLQLSVYAALFEENYNVKLSGVYVLGLEDGKISGSVINDDNDFGLHEIFKSHRSKKFRNSILERVDEGKYAMSCAVQILKAGKFAPEYQSDSCRFCSIKSICRKGEFKGELLEEEDDDEDE
ncbi:MAG: PD-(D/E)XK nuclease family protein, partial [Synergistaceae bacterium]|nr:PD-(D/E)XK nuclease family protein [Synergistaceae bacterium]